MHTHKTSDAVGESLGSELSEAALFAAAVLSREVAECVPASRRLILVAPNDAKCRTDLEKLFQKRIHLILNSNRQFPQTIFETRSDECSDSVPAPSESIVSVATPLIALLAAHELLDIGPSAERCGVFFVP